MSIRHGSIANSSSDVLRRFNHDTTLVTRVVLSLVLVAAAALGSEELIQTKSVRLTVADTVRATDQPQETQLTSSTPPDASHHSVETPVSNPSSPQAPSSQAIPIDTQIITTQRSPEPVEKFAEPKSEFRRHRISTRHKVADVKIRLLMLWHASLSPTGRQARSWTEFRSFNDHHWRANN
jgi:hypothetical protein